MLSLRTRTSKQIESVFKLTVQCPLHSLSANYETQTPYPLDSSLVTSLDGRNRVNWGSGDGLFDL